MVRVSSGKNSKQDYGTPQYIFDYFHLCPQGSFTLDAAASPENAKCETFYSKENCGLKGSWKNHSVWLNPPFSDVTPWIEKSINEILNNDCKSVHILLNADNGSRWYKRIWFAPMDTYFYLIDHRLRFVGADHSQSVPSMVVALKLPKDGIPVRRFCLVSPTRPSRRKL